MIVLIQPASTYNFSFIFPYFSPETITKIYAIIMFDLKKYYSLFIIIVVSCGIISCNSNNSKELTGEKFEMDFLYVDNIEDQDWIEIDGLRFIHLSDLQEISNTPWTLATSNVYMNKELMPDRTSPYTGLSIAIDLGNFLAGLNKNENLTSDSNITYEILNQPILLTHGKLTFMRSDSSTINIQVSPNYPVDIRVID